MSTPVQEQVRNDEVNAIELARARTANALEQKVEVVRIVLVVQHPVPVDYVFFLGVPWIVFRMESS